MTESIVGQKAPEFTAEAVVGTDIQKVSLSDYKGKWVVLFFYPLDFTFVCPTEIRGYNEKFEEFQQANAAVIGGSTDSIHSHKAWIEGSLGRLKFPLIADYKKDIAQAYGVLEKEQGVAFRGTFIIDPEGMVQYATIHNLDVGRNVEETLRVLKALQTGGLCQVGWTPGQETLSQQMEKN